MSYQTELRKGLLLGASAAVLWAVARRYGRGAERRMLDWDWATRVAVRTSGTVPALHPAARERLQEEYRAMLRRIEQPIADYTGTTLALSGTVIQVMDRHDWIRANVANFRELFEPVEQFYAESARTELVDLPGVAQAGKAVLSAQVGLLLGFLAQRVLGQYDLSLLGQEPLSAGRLYFVEPNIQSLEHQLQVPAAELRTWIALHEATHAHEFEVNPWVRTYMNATLQGYLRSVVDDMRDRSPGRGASSMLARLCQNLSRGHTLLEAMMTPHQRQLLSRLQALMSLAEGYSNHVMHNVGQELLSHYAEIQARVEQRQRQRGRGEQLLLKLTGLSLKMEQYALGETFVGRVVAERGIGFLNRAWVAAENLPTEAEIRQPERWIQRIDLHVA
ncbi:MAG: zinc-dependent metalloprotease [Chloroflexi bacterium]|nr:zinc-dependent metalloprotease [Chloroflexota bacterium]